MALTLEAIFGTIYDFKFLFLSRSFSQMDPLSDVIRLLRPRNATVGATNVGGPIAIRFPAHDGLFCYSVASGKCWLAVDQGPAPLLLQTGDCVVLPSGRPFVLASDLSLPPTDASVLFDDRPNGSIGVWNGGGDCTMFAAYFEFEARGSQFLLGLLAPVVRLQAPEARASLRHGIDHMIEELQGAQPGCDAIVEHLAHIALIKALRLHLAEATQDRTGWLFALSNLKLSAAITAMHSQPSKAWTVASLASAAGMSRTVFAVQFRHAVGVPPMDYLTRLRMLIAARMLVEPNARVAAVGRALGYDSESAFSTAFKRSMGTAPRRYARASDSA
jgi:AraC-like DNA-binding protein